MATHEAAGIAVAGVPVEVGEPALALLGGPERRSCGARSMARRRGLRAATAVKGEGLTGEGGRADGLWRRGPPDHFPACSPALAPPVPEIAAVPPALPFCAASRRASGRCRFRY